MAAVVLVVVRVEPIPVCPDCRQQSTSRARVSLFTAYWEDDRSFPDPQARVLLHPCAPALKNQNTLIKSIASMIPSGHSPYPLQSPVPIFPPRTIPSVREEVNLPTFHPPFPATSPFISTLVDGATTAHSQAQPVFGYIIPDAVSQTIRCDT